MSLIVLNSRGQDPAEFENHGFNLRLGKETQFCLCGVNLNRPPQTPLQLAIGDSTNNGWIIANGGRLQNDFQAHTPNYFRIKPGVYNVDGMRDEMTYAMNGNYLPEHKDNYGGMTISCWRKTSGTPLVGGLVWSAAGIPPAARTYTLNCSMTKIVNGMRTRLSSVFGAAGGAEFRTILPLTDAGNIPNGVPGVGDIVENATDPDYIDVRPSDRCKNFICVDPLWNTSNDGRAPINTPAGAIPADGTADGYTWGHEFLATDRPLDWVGKIRGGIVSSKWAGAITGVRDGENLGSVNEQGPQAMASRWGIAGTRFDLYWCIGPRTTPAAFQIEFYSTDMRKDGNYKNNPTQDTKWGELQIPQGAGFWEICMRPLQALVGTTYVIEAWARERAAPGGAQVGAVVLATGGGALGQYEINTTDKALYKHLPMFQGITYREQEPIVGVWSFRSIHHNARPNNGFSATTSLEPFSSGAPALNNATDITTCFSPTSINFQSNPVGGGPPSANPLRYDVVGQSNRRAAIAPCIGFQSGTLQTLAQATSSTTGLTAPTTSRDFESGEPVAIVQLTNIPLHGELGGGSTIWGGSNGGQVLGIANMENNGSYGAFNLGMNIYSEPSQTNWIDVGNMASDSLNQIRVKITDPTGRKIVGLFPDTTIWLKTRNKEHGETRTGGVDMRGNEKSSNW
tara:strand:+ start:223 stop:2265 length:2043 start_codon:yes stop_codon:yes gene_type:complete